MYFYFLWYIYVIDMSYMSKGVKSKLIKTRCRNVIENMCLIWLPNICIYIDEFKTHNNYFQQEINNWTDWSNFENDFMSKFISNKSFQRSQKQLISSKSSKKRLKYHKT